MKFEKQPKTEEDLAQIAFLKELQGVDYRSLPKRPLAVVVEIVEVRDVPRVKNELALLTVTDGLDSWLVCQKRSRVPEGKFGLFIAQEAVLPYDDDLLKRTARGYFRPGYRRGGVRGIRPNVWRNVYSGNQGVVVPLEAFPQLRERNVGALPYQLLNIEETDLSDPAVQDAIKHAADVRRSISQDFGEVARILKEAENEKPVSCPRAVMVEVVSVRQVPKAGRKYELVTVSDGKREWHVCQRRKLVGERSLAVFVSYEAAFPNEKFYRVVLSGKVKERVSNGQKVLCLRKDRSIYRPNQGWVFPTNMFPMLTGCTVGQLVDTRLDLLLRSPRGHIIESMGKSKVPRLEKPKTRQVVDTPGLVAWRDLKKTYPDYLIGIPGGVFFTFYESDAHAIHEALPDVPVSVHEIFRHEYVSVHSLRIFQFWARLKPLGVKVATAARQRDELGAWCYRLEMKLDE